MKSLRIGRGAVVSFVGGGGKTTAMFRLASEMSAAGLRVVTTTTTHILEEQTHWAPVSIAPGRLDLLSERLDRFGQCLIIGPPDGDGRAHGVPPDLIASLKARPDVDAVLVEADGSRMLPFKAPGGHEPVVPETTTVLVPVAGLESIGRPLDANHVHRPEIAASLARQQAGSPITAGTIARVLSHPEGGAKSCPPGARLIPILNKADGDDAMRHGGETAELLLENACVDSVILSSMLRDPPVLEVWAPVAGVIADAEQSRRYALTEQNSACGSEIPVVRAAAAALEANLDPVIAVLGYEAEKAAASLSRMGVQVVLNPEIESGRSLFIRKGMEGLPGRTGAALFFHIDQPPAAGEMIRTIVQAHRRTLAPACVPVFEGKRIGPALFDRVLFPELRDLHGDADGMVLLEKYRDKLVSVPASRAPIESAS